VTTVVTLDAQYWVLIPAAGIGQRMGSKIPKQYLKISHQSILEHTISLFLACSFIKKVIVIIHSEDKEWAKVKIDHAKVATVVGGASRADSVMRGLKYLSSWAAVNDWVLVHDAVRPCLQQETLSQFIKTMANHPVGGLMVTPVVDTIKKVTASGHVCRTIWRENLWIAQTPQMFRYGLLYCALQQALAMNVSVTDEASAVELAGQAPLIFEGDRSNIKVTQPDDLMYVRRYLGE